MDSLISEHSVIGTSDQQVSGSLQDGEMVILSLQQGVYYGLDPVGARIWELLQQPRTVGEVREILLNEYEVEPERCAQELSALLAELLENGLIEFKHGSGA
jgi:hypothetical protein